MKQTLATLLLSLALLSGNLSQAAAPVAGSVILSIGHNEAQSDGAVPRVLSRQSEVYTSDLIKTGPRGQLQIRFSDGSRLSLKPNTEFRIETYVFDQDKPAEGKAFYQLLKGGMRTLSGQIGKADPASYRVDAVVATIGIRGTYYGLTLCDSQCAERTGSEQGLAGEVLDGRIVVASEAQQREVGAEQFFFVASERPGEIDVSQDPSPALQSESDAEGSGEGEDGESDKESDTDSDSDKETDGASDDGASDDGADGSASDSSDQTSEKTEKDTALASGGSESEVASTDGQATEQVATEETKASDTTIKVDTAISTTLATSDPSTETTAIDAEKGVLADASQGGSATYTETAAPAGSLAAVAFTSYDSAITGYEGNGGSIEVAGQNSLKLATVNGIGNAVTGLYFVSADQTEPDPCNPCTFSAQSAALLNTGGDTVGLNWGRWDTGFYGEENGVPFNAVGSFHFIYSDKLTDPSTLAAKTGSYTYHYMGGTSPQIEDGSLGMVDSTSTYIQVDWSNQQVNGVSLGLNGFNDGRTITLLHASTSTPLNNVVTGGRIELSGACVGGACGTSTAMIGQMSLDFVGTSAERAISSFGANQDGTTSGVSVVGTAAFQ